MEKIKTFINRLERIGISVSLVSNVPWIYLKEVNGNKVRDKFLGNHGFTIAFYPIKKDQEMKFTDIPLIFQTIRKYL